MKSSLLVLFLAIVCYGHAQKFNADSLVSLMTVEEKIDFISGYQNFSIRGVERLGLPQIWMADGPMGVKGHDKATAFPASIAMAASWNPELIREMASAIALEAKSKGIGILLAPGTNIYRVPHCGRNFEYYGEDPYLASKMAVSFIEGVQREKVMATIKHLVANNQDYDRHRVSSDIDERTLHEIYFPAFKAAVQEAEVGAVMTSYNPLNGVHTSESSYLINDILKQQWGFEGMVVSDWISVYSTKAFTAGLDLEMPRAQFFTQEKLKPLIQTEPSYQGLLDDKVKRIIQTCHRMGLYETHKEPVVDWQHHRNLAEAVAREGLVLLKNAQAVLPLDTTHQQRILVLGPNAIYTPYSAGGAAMIEAYRNTSFLGGLQEDLPKGCKVDYLPVGGIYHQYAQVHRKQLKKTLKKAKNYDVIILCVGFNAQTEGEAFDRPLNLPNHQDFLVEELSKLHKRVITVVNAGGSIAMPWIGDVEGLVYAWYLGQEGGHALADLVFGRYSPSGKLPISIEKQWKDQAAFKSYDTTQAIAGAQPFYTLHGKAHEIQSLPYTEGLFTGYRHFDRAAIKPLFAFGYGLSYTHFEFSDLRIDNSIMKGEDSLMLHLKIRNTGSYAGAETVQLYIRDIVSDLERPKKELKAFKKVYLKPKESQDISFTIHKDVLAYYHPDKGGWIVEEGDFELLIGNASDAIKLREKVSFEL